MPRLHDLPLDIDHVAGRHTVKPELLSGSRHPAPWTSPRVESVRPCPLRQMSPGFAQLIVDAQGDNLNPILPLGVLLPESLQLGHWPLTRSTPGGPPLQQHYLASKIGQLGLGLIVQADELDIRGGCSRRKRAVLPNIVLKF